QQAQRALRPQAEPRPVALLRDPGRTDAPVLARGESAQGADRARDRGDPRQPHRCRGDGHQHRALQVAGLRRERGLHRGRGGPVGLCHRLRRAGFVQRVPVGDLADRQRHRRPGLDLGRGLRRSLHPVRPELGAGHLQGGALGDLRRVFDRLHVPDAVWHRRRHPATLDPGYPVSSSTGGAERRPDAGPYHDVNGGVLMRGTRQLLALVLALGVAGLAAVPAGAQTVVGVTATEIKIGNTNPYSGPASAYGTIGKVIGAYFKKVNDEGGVNGRKINYITYDDGYSPPKTV